MCSIIYSHLPHKIKQDFLRYFLISWVLYNVNWNFNSVTLSILSIYRFLELIAYFMANALDIYQSRTISIHLKITCRVPQQIVCPKVNVTSRLDALIWSDFVQGIEWFPKTTILFHNLLRSVRGYQAESAKKFTSASSLCRWKIDMIEKWGNRVAFRGNMNVFWRICFRQLFYSTFLFLSLFGIRVV